MKNLYILRGVSGSGKTTLANTLKESLPYSLAIAADDYFYNDDGVYCFNPDKLHSAHKWCKDAVTIMMMRNIGNIIVHNTFTSEWELAPYLELAKTYNYKVFTMVVENRHGNDSVHDVPQENRLKQEKKLRNSLKLL